MKFREVRLLSHGDVASKSRDRLYPFCFAPEPSS